MSCSPATFSLTQTTAARHSANHHLSRAQSWWSGGDAPLPIPLPGQRCPFPDRASTTREHPVPHACRSRLRLLAVASFTGSRATRVVSAAVSPGTGMTCGVAPDQERTRRNQTANRHRNRLPRGLRSGPDGEGAEHQDESRPVQGSRRTCQRLRYVTPGPFWNHERHRIPHTGTQRQRTRAPAHRVGGRPVTGHPRRCPRR